MTALNQIKEFNESLELPLDLVEKLICKQLLTPINSEITNLVLNFFHPKYYMNQDLKIIWTLLNNYWKKYNNKPSIDLLYKILANDKFKDKKEKLTSILNEIVNVDDSKYESKYIQDTLLNYIKSKAIYTTILDNIDDIQIHNDVSKIMPKFEQIIKISIDDDLGIEYFENIDNHISDLTNKEQRIPFLWKEWDKYTYGGIPIDDACLFMLMAQPGLGKSQFMMNIGYNWLMQNKNVLIISLEMSEKMYSARMSALFSDICVNKLKDNTEILLKKINNIKFAHPKSRLYIKQYSPSEFNSNKLKSMLDKYQKTKNFKPDLIIIDYLNIMATNGPSYHMKSYERVGTISKELRSISIETHIPILSATQTNRSGQGGGYAGEDISMSNTSDSAGINMDADALFAIYQLQGERELNRINIKILKNRLGGFVGSIFPMLVNYETLKISDWDSIGDEEQITDIDSQQTINEQIKDNEQKAKNDKEIDSLFNM